MQFFFILFRSRRGEDFLHGFLVGLKATSSLGDRLKEGSKARAKGRDRLGVTARCNFLNARRNNALVACHGGAVTFELLGHLQQGREVLRYGLFVFR